MDSHKMIYSKIVGVTFFERQTILKQLKSGDQLDIVREPKNEYDKNAIMVMTKSGLQIGYIPAKTCINLSKDMDSGSNFKVVIDQITGTDKQTLGCNIIIEGVQ